MLAPIGSASTMLLHGSEHNHRVLGGFSQTDSSGWLCTGDGNVHALI